MAFNNNNYNNNNTYNNYGYNNLNILDRIKLFFRQKSSLPMLILINILVWISVNVVSVILYLYNIKGFDADNLVLQWLAVPSNLYLIPSRLWTPFTYMFTHEGFFHILFNMLWLYWFGKIFLEFMNSSRLVWVYILGGLSGALFYIAAYNFFPVFQTSVANSILFGASASVMAVVTAISLYVPNYSINLFLLGRIKIYYFAIALFLLDFLMISGSNSGGHISHIGGAVFGGIYYLFLNYRSAFIGWVSKGKKNRFKHSDSKAGFSDEDYNRNKKNNENTLDAILDKIGKSGYESLSKAEKEFLFKDSKKS